MVREILLLGNPQLYEVSEPVTEDDAAQLPAWIGDLRDTLHDFRNRVGQARAIAAPQIGLKKRIIYMDLEREYVFINPVLQFPSPEKYRLKDDCMSFPGLIVRVRRHRRAVIEYLDEHFQLQHMELEGDYSELLQHEYDHLDGILATMRAVDDKSLYMREMKRDLT